MMTDVSGIFLPAGSDAVCAVALLNHEGDALLQLRDNKPGLRASGQWVFPGGHIESGESLEEGARREFLEETQYMCGKLAWVISVNDNFYPGWPPYPLHVFCATYDGFQSLRCMEGQDLKFISRREADLLPMPAYQRLLWDFVLLQNSTYKKQNHS